jgi:phosphonate transport system substrate-binding protein
VVREGRADRLAAFADALGSSLGRTVRTRVASSYADLLSAFEHGDVSLGWMPPVPALRGIQRGALTPIAIPMRGGSRGFFSVLFSRNASPFDSATRLMGARAAWVDPDSAAGYLITRAALAVRGMPRGSTFNGETFLGSHHAVIRAVLDGGADVGATYLREREGRETTSGFASVPGAAEQLRILPRTGPGPDDVLAVSTRVPAPYVEHLQRPFIEEETSPAAHAAACSLFEADRFVPPVQRHLEPIVSMLTGW